ncbi:MAG: exosortase-associated EpsI family protein [Verrucomicrobiota bacterium]|jgi:hypothetical protein
MRGRELVVLVVGLAIIAAAGGVLIRAKAAQRLGEPGVKLVRVEGGGVGEIPLPVRVRQYSSTNVPMTTVEKETLPADTTFARRLYSGPGGAQLLLMVVLMGADRTSIHKPELCLTSQGWQIQQMETTQMRVGEPRPYELPLRKFVLRQNWRDAGGRVREVSGVYTFWFVCADRITASHWARVGYMTWDLLRTGVLPRWAYVGCFVQCPPGQEAAAFEREKQFLSAAVPEFQTAALPAGTVASP